MSPGVLGRIFGVRFETILDIFWDAQISTRSAGEINLHREKRFNSHGQQIKLEALKHHLSQLVA